MTSEKKVTSYSKSDILGMTSAALCAVHCLAMPILIAVSLTYRWLDGLCYIFLAIGVYAAYRATKCSPLWLKVIIWGSLVMMLTSILLESVSPISVVLNYIAAAGLITGHYINYRQTKHS